MGKSKSQLYVKIPSRIHINLIAMHECPFRLNGGLGFSVFQNKNHLIATTHSDITVLVDGITNDELRISQIVNLLINVKQNLKLITGVKIILNGEFLFHVGLGTGTAITLASIECLLRLNNIHYTEDDVIKFSNRGGTSGIGVNSYFCGGFIYDLGIPNIARISHQPSALAQNPTRPTLLSRVNIPDWKVGLIIPNHKVRISGKIESDFFHKTCPIPKEKAFEAAYVSIFGTLASVIEQDYDKFCLSIKEIQKTYWKQAEISESTNFTGQVALSDPRIDCYGLTSFGPGMYIFGADIDKFGDDYTNQGLGQFINLEVCNAGRSIEWR